MSRRLPPFAAVRAFEAAARLGSFKAAAAELCVTQSAVSHQVKSLEAFAGRTLFDRTPAGIVLTADGESYFEEVGILLDRFEASTQSLLRGEAKGRLRVRSTPGFAHRWLVPRLSRFAAAHPDIELDLSTDMPPTDFAAADCDVLVHWKDSPLAGAVVEPFFASIRFAVASPALVAGRMPASVADFEIFTLLHDTHADAWDDYMASAGGVDFDISRGPRFDHCDLTLAAVEAGQGISLAYELLAEDMLRDGRIVRVLDHEVGPYLMHSVAYAPASANCARVTAFRDWIFAEAGAQERNVGEGPPTTRLRQV
ncbi:LysR substrate-binding domain-containing protein [Tepidamorphus sp. 3E244]|uniref:LysR substrate-binding domain-containing protein n=1 Tax=Tepidamorphus sp. 3E244 TaxID=3385498 RepID=UPI0038FD1681